LQRVFRQVFEDDQITLNDELSAKDFDNWDSLQYINLIIAIETHFKIKFATAEISRLKAPGQTVGSLLTLIAGKTGAHRCSPAVSA
jgi:acyl carrier protein